MKYLSLFGVVLLFSYLLTGGLRKFALKRNIIDIPNVRSSHVIPTPRGGGLAIVITFCAAILFFALEGTLDWKVVKAILVGGGLIAFIGFLDDCFSISPLIRLLVQIISSLIALYYLDLLSFTYWGVGNEKMAIVIIPLLLFTLIWSTNLYNFMDGIDGIASVEAITISCSAGVIIWLNNGDHGFVFLLLSLTSATIGFLIWNWPPAKIFLGDSGSGFLGFIFCVLAIVTSLQNGINMWSWLILGAVFLADATVTLLRRLFRGEKIYEAHRSHVYQALSSKFNSHKRVVLRIMAVNILWLLPLALGAEIYPQWTFFFLLVSYLPLLIISFRFVPRKH